MLFIVLYFPLLYSISCLHLTMVILFGVVLVMGKYTNMAMNLLLWHGYITIISFTKEKNK